MAIIHFETKGYEKLALRNIKQITMDPVSKLQAILGTNGSGKSSLIEELSPLCAAHDEYRADGYKKITITRRGNTYDCLSDFAGGKKHFELHKNGSEIYSGHSSTAYNAHVKSELGITPDIHAMRIGEKRFTTMDRESRRAWFTNLSPEDYTYAIGYYKRLSEATRDISGSIKRINTRLLQEKDKLVDAEAEKILREEINGFNQTKSEIMQHWRPMEISVDQALGNVSDIDSKLTELTLQFDQSIRVFCNAKGYTSQQDIWDDISNTQASLTVLETQIAEIHGQIEVNEKLILDAIRAAGNDEVSIRAKMADVSREIISDKLGIFADDWLNDAKAALIGYDAVVPELLPLMDMLVVDETLEYTQAKHKVNSDELANILKAITGFEGERQKRANLIEIYEHKAQSNHTECPKCQHTWISGYNQRDHDTAITERDKIDVVLDEYRTKYNALHELLETSSYQLQLMNQIGLLARANPILASMWRGLTDKHFIRISPKTAIEYVKATRAQIIRSIELTEHQQQLAELEISLASATSATSINQQELQDKNDLLESRLIKLQNDSYFYQKQLDGLKKAQKAMEFQESFTPIAEDLISKRGEWINKAEIANHHTAVSSVLMYIDTEVGQRERILSQIDSQHRLISTLETEVIELKSKEKMMKEAMKALSPSAGLIAKGLTGFINHFIAQMNAVIEKVWLYPLVIKTVVITDERGVDLDYKFSYTVDGKPAGKDISEGSGAQKEIFDLAFMLVSMIHLGLEDSEIFLDEFSIKMDYAHRQEAMKMVMDLVTASNFSQIFMISHYESSYGALTDVDITVLCSENIQIPQELKYNVNSKVVI